MDDKQIDFEKIFNELKEVPPRDPKRATQARAKFLSQAVVIRNGAVSQNRFLRLREWLDKFNQIKEIKMTTLITIITILGLVFGGGAGTVYAAQGSLPTEFLYGVKIAAEDAALGFASDSQAEFDLLLEYSQRREDEILALLEAGVVPPEEVVVRMQAQFDTAIALVGEMQEENAAEAMLRIQELAETQFLEVTGFSLPAGASPEAVAFLESAQADYENALLITENLLIEAQALSEGAPEGLLTPPASRNSLGTPEGMVPTVTPETPEGSLPTSVPDMPTLESAPTSVPDMPTAESAPTSVPDVPTAESVLTSVPEVPTAEGSGMGN